MDDENLYDEFGNYIGPDLDEQEEEDIDSQYQQNHEEIDDNGVVIEEELPDQNEHKIVLHEDKKYFPDHEEVYPGAETLVNEEDTMDIDQPMIEKIKPKNFDLVEQKQPETTFDYQFMTDMMNNPQLIRNVAIVGHIHQGKNLLVDMFVQQTHLKNWDLDTEVKYTDTRMDEQERKISIKAAPMSLILPDSKDKSYLVNIFDTPGHPNFSDEVCCAVRACDGAILVVDAVEGVMLSTENIIRYLVRENIAITVVITKMDRLVLELKIPPADAYLKINHTIEEINGIIQSASFHLPNYQKVSPLLGNVAFSSGKYGFVFTLKSFSEKYAEQHPGVDKQKFSQLLWGDVYYNQETRKFSKSPSKDYPLRTFVQFVLEPLYKLLAYSISHEYEELMPFLGTLGVTLRKQEYKLDSSNLLKLICLKWFGNTSSLVDLIVNHIPSPAQATSAKLEKIYSGKKDNQIFKSLQKCDPNGPLLINIVKLYNKPDCLTFDAFGRVLSGTIHKNQTVKVLGENYRLEDEEDMAIKNVKTLSIYQSRYKVDVNKVPAGNWVLIEGIEQSISKTATITSANETEPIEILKPIRFNTQSVIKVACEPLVPSELPKMLEGIRKINKSYPLLTTKVEESGEHILIGTGELYMDCVLHDLRQMYSEIEIKVSDPSVTFCETVIDSSSIKCYGETPNKKNKITILAGPLDKGLSDDIDNEQIDLLWDKKVVSEFFQTKYEWDLLASRSIWAFGPDSKSGSNLLLDDTLPSETNKNLLYSVKDPLVQGFQWSTREGPLCEEPMRNVKFKIIEANISDENIYRGGGQMIPTTRRVCYSSFLTATPRMMEPMFLTEIQCTADSLDALYVVLQRRRGHVISETAKAGSPLYTVKAHIPAIDSFGFETDLRIHTSGQAFCLQIFDHWSMLPGDPLDKSIQLKLLEPSPPPHLAREFMIKTRRRKGLNEDVSILKYFDDPRLIDLLKNDDDYKTYI